MASFEWEKVISPGGSAWVMSAVREILGGHCPGGVERGGVLGCSKGEEALEMLMASLILGPRCLQPAWPGPPPMLSPPHLWICTRLPRSSTSFTDLALKGSMVNFSSTARRSWTSPCSCKDSHSSTVTLKEALWRKGLRPRHSDRARP